MDNLMPAVRAFNKLWTPIAARLEEAERLDAGFDAGEFSGPCHANIQEDAYHKALAAVALRYHVDVDTLENAMRADQHEQVYRFMNSQGLRK